MCTDPGCKCCIRYTTLGGRNSSIEVIYYFFHRYSKSGGNFNPPAIDTIFFCNHINLPYFYLSCLGYLRVSHLREKDLLVDSQDKGG